MREQEFHLIGQNAPALEINIFRIGRCKGHCDQLHAGLFRRLASLMVIAAPASCDDIGPSVHAALAQRPDMITRQFPGHERGRAIHAEIRIAAEESLVIKRRYIAITPGGAAACLSDRSHDGIDFNHAAHAGGRADAAVNPIQESPAGVSNLLSVVQADGVPVVNPLQWHAGNIRSQDLLRKISDLLAEQHSSITLPIAVSCKVLRKNQIYGFSGLCHYGAVFRDVDVHARNNGHADDI